jgi:hypothetical protein
MRTHNIISLELTIAINNTQRPQVPTRSLWLGEILHGIMFSLWNALRFLNVRMSRKGVI